MLSKLITAVLVINVEYKNDYEFSQNFQLDGMLNKNKLRFTIEI